MEESATSKARLKVSVKRVFTAPSEKISQPGRRLLTKILPVSFSKNDGHSSTRTPWNRHSRMSLTGRTPRMLARATSRISGRRFSTTAEQFLDSAEQIVPRRKLILGRWDHHPRIRGF